MSTPSSFCAWLIRRELLSTNPLAQIDRPVRQDSVPAVPAPSLMDALVEEAKHGAKSIQLKLGRSTAGTLGTFQALEILALGVLGKLALWRALIEVAPSDARLSGVDFFMEHRSDDPD